MNLSRVYDRGKCGRTELDSHADTIAGGSNCRVHALTGQTVKVSGFNDSIKAIDGIPVATLLTAWTDPQDGQVYILVLNEALYFGNKMDHTLLNPNQLRDYGCKVYEVPKQFDPESPHSIVGPPDSGIHIPLELDGIISGFESHYPTNKELEECVWVTLTSDAPWDPNDSIFVEREELSRRVSSVYTVNAVHGDLANGPSNHSMLPTPFETLLEEADDMERRLMSLRAQLQPDGIEDALGGERDSAVRNVSALKIESKQSVLTNDRLAEMWGCGLGTAKQTIQATTQVGVRTILNPVDRRYRTRQSHLRYPNIRSRIYSDTMFGKVKSVRQYNCAQVFTDGKGWDHFYPMKTKSEAGDKLMNLIQDYNAIPKELVSDNAKEETYGKWGQICRDYHIKRHWSEPYSAWQNRAEAAIREIKRAIRRHTIRRRSPRRLWCFLGEWVAALRRHTASDHPSMDGRVPEEFYHGDMVDISAYAQFGWYEPAWHTRHDGIKEMVMWIGVAKNHGTSLCWWALRSNGQPVVTSSLSNLTEEEQRNIFIQDQVTALRLSIDSKIGDHKTDQEVFDLLEGDVFPGTETKDVLEDIFGTDYNEDDSAETDAEQVDAEDEAGEHFDKFLTAEVQLARGDNVVRGRVVGRSRDTTGAAIGKWHPNPLLSTAEYEVELPDGEREAYSANLIAESIYAELNDQGEQMLLLKEIVDHKKDASAVHIDDGFVNQDKKGKQGGNVHRRITTKGWKLLVEWKDGSSSWLPLKDLKNSHPMQTAQYAVANKLASEPAFAWWIHSVLRKKDRIISKVKSKYWKRTHKYGIELPHSVEEAYAIASGTDFWARAIAKEMKNVMVAFDFPEDGNIPIGYKPLTVHMVFDIKFDLTRKARLVADGHKVAEPPPPEECYSSVVARDSLRIFFTLAALNDLEVLSADVQNAYLNAPAVEKLYIKSAGAEFGPDKQGRPCTIVRALYGLSASGASWHRTMSKALRQMNFFSSRGDPDVWMRPATKADGSKYYEYILLYVDDVLCQSEYPKKVMDEIASLYTLKDGTIKEPTEYLGAQVKKWKLEDSDEPGKTRWAMSSDLYVDRAIKDVETELEYVGKSLPKNIKTPMASGYRPELDVTPELNHKQHRYYQGLIGVLRWMIELGRVDILYEISVLSRFLANPRKGHLDQVFHVFAYLKGHAKSTMVFDDTRPNYDESRFKIVDWGDQYPDAGEPMPTNVPEARGKPVLMTCFVDADHAGCRVTRRSHTGVVIYVNRAPIIWYSKRQNTVESSTFGSEFVAMKQAIDLVEGIRYKLRMFGVLIDGATSIFSDSESVVKNTTAPESALKKKHNAICYHRCREAQAGGWCRVTKEDGLSNVADLFTKGLPAPRRKQLVSAILW